MSNASEDLDKAQLARSLGLSPEYVRTACSRPSVQMSARDGGLTTHTVLQDVIVDFFNENTVVFSGAARKTRRLLKSRTELLQLFLPSCLLRAKAAALP